MMWRSNHSEEWERRKTYLIRSLFEDLPILSPVPEAEECTGRSPSLVLRPAGARDYSPLPPLIIEPEPNRHDEPESFYFKLEKKVKNYYKKLFIKNSSGTSSSSDDSDMRTTLNLDDVNRCDDTGNIELADIPDEELEIESNNETGARRLIELEECCESEEYRNNEGDFYLTEQEDHSEAANVTQSSSIQCVEAEEYIPHLELNTSKTRTNSVESESQSQYKDIVARTSDTSSGPNYVQVTFEADVHKEPSDDLIEKTPSLVYDIEIRAWREVVRTDLHPPEILREARTEDLEESLVPGDVNDHSADEEEEQNEIEAMRTPRNRSSFGSLENVPYKESSSGSISAEHRERTLEFHTDTNLNIEDAADHNMELADNTEIRTSTPRREECLITVGNNEQRSSIKRSGVTTFVNTNNKRRRENVAVQTVCGERLFHRRVLRDNFFVGTPKVFKLCSCENHTCGC